MTLKREILPCPDALLPDRWAYAFVERRRSGGEIAGRWEIIDLDPASEKLNGGTPRYRSDGFGAIRCKCIAIAAVLPLYTVAYMTWHVARAPFTAISHFFQTVEEMLNRPSCSVFVNLALSPLRHGMHRLWLAVRAPFCMIAMQSAALYGLVRPLEGRLLCGAAERYWRGTAPFTLDFHSGYLARCFQPYGTLNEPSLVSVQFSIDRDSVG